MPTLNLDASFGHVLFAAVGIYLQQQVAFTLYVGSARRSTGIKAPTLYPRDSQIKELKLSDDQVKTYMRSQRIHQNTVELASFRRRSKANLTSSHKSSPTPHTTRTLSLCRSFWLQDLRPRWQVMLCPAVCFVRQTLASFSVSRSLFLSGSRGA